MSPLVPAVDPVGAVVATVLVPKPLAVAPCETVLPVTAIPVPAVTPSPHTGAADGPALTSVFPDALPVGSTEPGGIVLSLIQDPSIVPVPPE